MTSLPSAVKRSTPLGAFLRIWFLLMPLSAVGPFLVLGGALYGVIPGVSVEVALGVMGFVLAGPQVLIASLILVGVIAVLAPLPAAFIQFDSTKRTVFSVLASAAVAAGIAAVLLPTLFAPAIIIPLVALSTPVFYFFMAKGLRSAKIH